MDPRRERELLLTRRHFFQRSATGLGAGLGTAALAGLLGPEARAGSGAGPHLAPRAKRVIYLCMAGAPPQLDLWDYKPGLEKYFDQDLPDSVRMGQRITTMTSGQERFPVAPSMFRFHQAGECGTWISELLPHTAKVVDDLCVMKTLHTNAINHDPAITFLQTGHEQPGRPSAGAWVSYGLGSSNQDLPTFVVLHSSWSAKRDAQALYARLWGSGFLPTTHQGVSLRSSGDPVLYLANPAGMDDAMRRRMLDRLGQLNQLEYEALGDPEIQTRISQYEMAYRMQRSVPDLMDFSDEPEHVLELYGPDVRKPGTFAANCLLARRLAERNVRFTQVFIRGWDQHTDLPRDLRLQCKDTDQPCAALIQDLKQRGLLEDTLVLWGGEFGRTVYCQGRLTRDDYGRDHHPRCFTMWMAGGGTKGGQVYGETDDYSYNIVRDPMHINDLHATLLHCLGIDHERLTWRHMGRDFRLTDVAGEVVTPLLA